MKKIVLLAAFAALGMAGTSCTSDDNQIEGVPGKVVKSEIVEETVLLKEGDSIPEGPGDDQIIVPPPPPRP